MLLLCSFFRLKETFQEKNGLTTSLLFFFENAKNLGRSTTTLNVACESIRMLSQATLNGEKKEDGLKRIRINGGRKAMFDCNLEGAEI